MRVVAVQDVYIFNSNINQYTSDLPWFSHLFCFGFPLFLLHIILASSALIFLSPGLHISSYLLFYGYNFCCNDGPSQGVILSLTEVIGSRFLHILKNCSAV